MDFELSVNVLTATFWPNMSVDDQKVIYPPQVRPTIKTYEGFYHNKFNGRRLTWQPSLGTAEIRVQFKNRKHDLTVATYALIVLLLFEDVPSGESLSYADIRNSTNIKDADLQRTLQSLACAKYKILTKDPKGRDVKPDDRFSFNESFTAPLAKIKIPQIVQRVETKEERNQTTEKVQEERNHLMDVSARLSFRFILSV